MPAIYLFLRDFFRHRVTPQVTDQVTSDMPEVSSGQGVPCVCRFATIHDREDGGFDRGFLTEQQGLLDKRVVRRQVCRRSVVYKFHGGSLVRVVGIEPTLREEKVFETFASTVPPHPQRDCV